MDCHKNSARVVEWWERRVASSHRKAARGHSPLGYDRASRAGFRGRHAPPGPSLGPGSGVSPGRACPLFPPSPGAHCRPAFGAWPWGHPAGSLPLNLSSSAATGLVRLTGSCRFCRGTCRGPGRRSSWWPRRPGSCLAPRELLPLFSPVLLS